MLIQNLTRPRLGALLALFLILLQSCTTVRLISDYDEITDKTVTRVQEKVTKYFVVLDRTIGTPAAAYENFVETFDYIKVDLNTLKLRTAALDKNRIVEDQIKELISMVDNLEKLHKIGFLNAAQIRPLKQPFDSAFTAIIRLQLALKRGEK